MTGESQMRAIFVANVKLDNNEGIYKKIKAEAVALGNAVGECYLIIGNPSGNGSKIFITKDNSEQENKEKVLAVACDMISKGKWDVLYIRLMIPSFSLIKLMKIAQKKDMSVYYEIPTYPYYAEQFRTSRKKYRAIAKLTIDKLFSPFVYKYSTWIPLIRSNSKIVLKDKMLEITNGVKTEGLKEKTYLHNKNDAFRMVTVGTLYPYHGYDRILRGLKKCNEMVDGIPVEFHIIGKSQTIDDLKCMAEEMSLEKVYFHGVKTTEELNELYENFDIGLACMALHRRNADIDTTLKIIEYYCRGIPVATSGISPMDKYMPEATIKVPDGEDALSIKSIYEQYKRLTQDDFVKIAPIAKDHFNWDWIFNDLIERTLNRG